MHVHKFIYAQFQLELKTFHNLFNYYLTISK